MEMPRQQTIDNAIKLLGEALLPGASLLMEGKIVAGSAHLLVGAWAKASIGPLGVALVIANSYTESVTGSNLLKHLAKFAQEVQGGQAGQAQQEPKADGQAA